jgi:SSS family solute:Na+ symporter
MFGLGIADIIVIIAYFVVMVGIGAWASRRIRNQEDYFLAGRRFGKLVQTFAAFGQATSADNAVGVTTTTFMNGIAGIWSSMLYLFATPLYWLVTHWPRRMRVLTLGDYFKERYHSTAMGAVYSLIGAFGMMAFIALGFNAMTKTILAITPRAAATYTEAQREAYTAAYNAERIAAQAMGTPPMVLTLEELLERERLSAIAADERTEEQAARLMVLDEMRPATMFSHLTKETIIWGVCVVVLLYAVVGGLVAAFVADMVQGMFIILLSVLLIPFGWARINDLYGGRGIMDAIRMIHSKLPESYFQVFGAPQTPDFTWYYVITLSFMAAITVVVQPNGAVLAGSAKDELSNRSGVVMGNFLKRFCTIGWAAFGLIAIVLYSGKVIHSDLIWGHATRDLLGPFNIGLVGLMIACLLAALLSTVDCYMITCSSLLTHNFYTPLVSGRSPRHYVWAGRITGALIVFGGGWVALQFDTILQILKFIWEMNVMLAPAYWLGIKWRRANRAGAWASIGIGSLLFLILPFAAPMVRPSMRYDEALLRTTQPAPRVVTERARELDVERRREQIARWDALERIGKAEGPRPAPLAVGELFEQRYEFAKRSIFWTQEIKADEQGRLYGKGRFNVELWILERLGVDLESNPYALNETLRILFRTLAPFGIMIVVSLLSRPDPAEVLTPFYAKMRTQVIPDPKADAEAVAHSLKHPEQTEHRLLFPNTSFEFYKWSRLDVFGFALSVLGVGAVLLLTWVVAAVGG